MCIESEGMKLSTNITFIPPDQAERAPNAGNPARVHREQHAHTEQLSTKKEQAEWALMLLVANSVDLIESYRAQLARLENKLAQQMRAYTLLVGPRDAGAFEEFVRGAVLAKLARELATEKEG